MLTKLMDHAVDDEVGIQDTIKVNVSGREFEINCTDLFMHSHTLLASSEREHFYNEELDAYFFDRNRTVFEVIHQFYQNHGRISFPDYIGDAFIEEELFFFGIPYVVQDCSDTESECTETDSDGNKPTICNKMEKFLNDPTSSTAAKGWMILDIILITIAMIHFTIDTQQQHLVPDPYHDYLEFFCEVANIVTVGFFTVDFILRLVVSSKKLAFCKSVTNWLDFLAIIPFYIEGVFIYFGLDAVKFKILKLFRVTRIARVLKVIKHSKRLLVIGLILYECLNELAMLFVFWSLGVLFSGSLEYYAENGAGSGFDSILASCWWAVVTMSSVGYGDIYPVTIAGKIIGSGVIFCSMVFMAVPMTIIVTKFGECYEKMKKLPGSKITVKG